MRILHVSQPVTGGVCTVVTDLARHQTTHGHEVHVVSPSGVLADLVADSAAWYEWPATRSPGVSALDESRRLSSLIESVDPEVIHLHSSKAGLCGRLAIRGRRPTVFQPHGWSFLAVEGLAERLTRTWERNSARWAHVIVCVSTAEQNIGEAAGVRPVRYERFTNAVQLAHFGALSQRDARESLGLAVDAPLVLCVARLSHQKGIDLLFEAWQQVHQTHPEAQLLVVGDGPDRSKLESRAQLFNGTVRLTGMRTDVPAWYAASDLVVLSSRYEGMALTPLEAMASARPVVGFDVPGFAESMGSAPEPDVVLPPEDTRALADAICRRLANPHLRQREGERNLQHVRDHHDAEPAAQRMSAVYESLTQPK